VSDEAAPPPEADEHARAEAQFSAFIDGMLAAADRTALEQHLATCERCRGELDSFKQTMAAVQKSSAVTPSPEFMDKLRSQIRTRSRGRFFADRPRSYRLEIASLVTLVIAVTIYLVLQMVQPMLLLR
jgi:anti-sigma factor RsiW